MTRLFSQLAQVLKGAAVLGITGLALLFIVRMTVNEPEYAAGVSYSRDVTYPVPANVRSGEITADVAVGQTFRARAPNMDRVEVTAVTFDRLNTAPLIFSLFAEGNNEPIRTIAIGPEGIINDKPLTAHFEPIAESAGTRYLLTLESPQGRPGNAFGVWLGGCDCNPDGDLFVAGKEQDGRDLVLAVAYQNPGVSIWRELLNRISQYKPGFFKGAFLVAVGGAAFGFSALAFTLFVISSVLGKPASEGAKDPQDR